MALGDSLLGESPIGAAGPMAILKQTASLGKYGHVVVNNGDGSFNREFKITAAELATLHASGNGIPPGVTQQEWESGQARVYGKDFEIGDMKVYPDGTIKMKYDERVVDGRIVEGFCILGPSEYTGTAPDITVTKAVLDTLTYGQLLGPVVQVNSRILSIAAGQVETK